MQGLLLMCNHALWDMIKKCHMAVIGAGVFGAYHAQKCADNPRIELCGIYDKTSAKAQILADQYNANVYSSLEALFDDVDAVVIACSATSHGEVALAALTANKHCLIEKPIAVRLDAAHQITDMATERGLVVQVGHQERLVAKAIGLDKIDERPLQIITKRMAPSSSRGNDVSVTLDLMTHDIDLIMMLIGEMPSRVSGKTIKSPGSTQNDYTKAQLEWDGIIAELTASRMEEGFTRTMQLTFPSGQLNIDFNNKTLTHDTPFDLDEAFGGNPMAKDSLGAATEHFVASILDGHSIIVSASDGYNALKIANEIDKGAS